MLRLRKRKAEGQPLLSLEVNDFPLACESTARRRTTVAEPAQHSEAQIAEPIYTMLKIEAGDYLLPSHDRRILWRITACEEGGRLRDLRTGLRHLLGVLDRALPTPEEHFDLEEHGDGGWELQACAYRTRKEAVQEAMRLAPRVRVEQGPPWSSRVCCRSSTMRRNRPQPLKAPQTPRLIAPVSRER